MTSSKSNQWHSQKGMQISYPSCALQADWFDQSLIGQWCLLSKMQLAGINVSCRYGYTANLCTHRHTPNIHCLSYHKLLGKFTLSASLYKQLLVFLKGTPYMEVAMSIPTSEWMHSEWVNFLSKSLGLEWVCRNPQILPLNKHAACAMKTLNHGRKHSRFWETLNY